MFSCGAVSYYGSGETEMNRLGSYPNHENRPLYERPQHQGLYEARRAGGFFEFLVTDPPQGRPVGGGGIHRTRWIKW